MMIDHISSTALSKLRHAGWRVEQVATTTPLPPHVVARYEWLPVNTRHFFEGLAEASSPDQKAWLLSASDFIGSSASAYAWNEWEVQSLAAAIGDQKWMERIRGFWSQHFPILMSVKSGYAFLAIERQSLGVVVGEEPEFEETSPLAGSIDECLQLMAAGDSRLARWI